MQKIIEEKMTGPAKIGNIFECKAAQAQQQKQRVFLRHVFMRMNGDTDTHF